VLVLGAAGGLGAVVGWGWAVVWVLGVVGGMGGCGWWLIGLQKYKKYVVPIALFLSLSALGWLGANAFRQ
jgi:hypothetical protein